MDSLVVYYMGRKYRVIKGPHTARVYGEVRTRLVLMDIEGYKVSVDADRVTPVNKQRSNND